MTRKTQFQNLAKSLHSTQESCSCSESDFVTVHLQVIVSHVTFQSVLIKLRSANQCENHTERFLTDWVSISRK